jgi:hypothetical protein
MRPLTNLRRTLRKAVTGLALSLALGAGLLSPAGPAAATTGDGQISHVWLDLGDEPTDGLADAYSTFLNSLRGAVGYSAQGVQVTQHASQNEGVVRVSLAANDDSGNRRGVDLWVNPDNLYVVGYSPQATPGVSYTFSDVHASSAMPSHQNLPFGGNYNSLVGAANRNRSDTPVAFWSIRQAIIDLANQRSANDRPQTTARALLLLVQVTAEAARFSGVEEVFRGALSSWESETGIPEQLQHLENNWGTVSNFFWNSLGMGDNPNPAALNISGISIRNADDVRRRVRTVLPGVVGKPYNPGHDEL